MKARLRAAYALTIGCLQLLGAPPTHAEPTPEASTSAPSSASPSTASATSTATDAVPAVPAEVAPPQSYWSTARTRPFVAGLIDVGAFVRGKLMLGYGKPHWTWAGLELEGLSSTEVGFTALRARLALVILDLAVAYRRTWSYRRSLLSPEPSYRDADLTGGSLARYHSLDLWAWGLIPTGLGFFDWEVEAIRALGLPRDVELFEEWLRTPVPAEDWATASRLGYAFTFWRGRIALGAMGEWLWPGHRGSLWRVGPLGSITFSPHWELAGLALVVVQSPDQFSFYTGLWGTLRVRYRFATGQSQRALH